jgi:hypothetical protein
MIDNINPQWIERVLDWRVERAQAETIYDRREHTSIQRVILDGGKTPPSIIIKHTFPPKTVHSLQGSLDPYEFVREYNAYQVLPSLGVPTAEVFASILDPSTEENILVMEDLTLTRVIYPEDHRWSQEEYFSILNTYVALHTAGLNLGAGDMLRQHWPWLQDESAQVGEEQAWQITRALLASPLTGKRLAPYQGTLEALTRQADNLRTFLGSQPQTFNYNDFFPGNIALPRSAGRDSQAVLFDWHLLGAGAPQSDLLNIFWVDYSLGADLDQLFSYYLNQLNQAAETAFDLSWIRAGLLSADLSGTLFSLWQLVNRLPQFEQGLQGMPGWMEASLVSLTDGSIDQKLREFPGDMS